MPHLRRGHEPKMLHPKSHKGEELEDSALKVLVHNMPTHIALCVRCCMELEVPFIVCYEKADPVSFNSDTAVLGVSKSLCVSS